MLHGMRAPGASRVRLVAADVQRRAPVGRGVGLQRRAIRALPLLLLRQLPLVNISATKHMLGSGVCMVQSGAGTSNCRATSFSKKAFSGQLSRDKDGSKGPMLKATANRREPRPAFSRPHRLLIYPPTQAQLPWQRISCTAASQRRRPCRSAPTQCQPLEPSPC